MAFFSSAISRFRSRISPTTWVATAASPQNREEQPAVATSSENSNGNRTDVKTTTNDIKKSVHEQGLQNTGSEVGVGVFDRVRQGFEKG